MLGQQCQILRPGWGGQILRPSGRADTLPCATCPGWLGTHRRRGDVLVSCMPQGSAWALSSSSATAHAGGPFPWGDEAPSSPARALGRAWVLHAWPGVQRTSASRRSRGVGDGVDTVRSLNPSSDFSCGLTSSFSPGKGALSTPRDLRRRGETSLCPTSPCHLPFLRCRAAGAGRGGERSQPRGGLGPSTSFLCSCNPTPPATRTPTLPADQWV